MPGDIRDTKVAILCTKGVEQAELTEPRRALDEAGATTHLIAPDPEPVTAWRMGQWGDDFTVDVPLDQASPDDYDALVLPGGVMNPDHLRMNERAVAFVQAFFEWDKPVAAICHGPWMLVEADVVDGRRITSWPSLKTDLRNAGAEWVDERVVVDDGLVTSRMPDDIPAFNTRMIEEIGRGLERRRAA